MSNTFDSLKTAFTDHNSILEVAGAASSMATANRADDLKYRHKVAVKLPILFVLPLILLLSCAENEERGVNINSLIERDDLSYLSDSQQPFTGEVFDRHEDGTLLLEGYVGEGQRDGKWTTWHENGQKQRETFYKDGKRDGVWLGWDENGQKIREENYLDGERVRTRLRYGNGQLLMDEVLEQSASITWWYENGQKNLETFYEGDERDGVWSEWHENGQQQSRKIFKDGKQDGLSIGWHADGQKHFEEHYIDGKREGLSSWWYENGQMKSESSFRDGKRIESWSFWYADGRQAW